VSLAFSRSTRALEADRGRVAHTAILVALLLLGAWIAWSFVARVPIFETSDAARLEVERASHPVEASVAGRIHSTRLAVGRTVNAGEVLVELDATTQKLQLQEEQTRTAAIVPQLEALARELAAAEQTLADLSETGNVLIEEARAKHKQEETAARFAKEEADRKRRAGGFSDLELLRADAEAENRAAAAETARLAVSRILWEQRTKVSGQVGTVEHLKREVARLEGEMAAGHSTIRRLEEEIDKRLIRAPVAGLVGESANLRVGMTVVAGARLGAVVPAGGLRLVADFLPSSALGRIREGQPARLRLEGFPWTQYGTVEAVVSSVAGEVRDGKVRVEFILKPEPGSRIPLQHGLPGTVEVETDRIAPAALVLRSLSRLFASGGNDR